MTIPAGEVPEPKEPPKSRPGPAYFGMDSLGIVRLAVDGSMRRILSHPTLYHDMVVGPDGRTVWVASDDGVWRIVGDSVQRVSEFAAVEVAPTPDGGVVALGLQPKEGQRTLFEIYRYRAGRWTQVPGYRDKRTDGLSPWMMHDVAVDAQGRVHLGSSGGWWREQEGEWKRFGTAVPSLETLFFTEISPGHDGVMFGTCNGGLFYVTPDDAMFRVPIDPGEEGFHDVTVGPTGEVAMIGALDEIVRIRPGARGRVTKLGALKAPGTTVRDVEIDGQSRTWLATDDSLTLLGPNDEVLQQWARGTLDAINGNIRSLAVIRDGPALPTQTDPVVGSVIGKFDLTYDQPYGPTARVLLCLHGVEYDVTHGGSVGWESRHCAPGTVIARAPARPTGEFRFDNIPRGMYVLVDPSNASTLFTDCSEMTPGGTVDLGMLDIRF